jgi:hypothetical protein
MEVTEDIKTEKIINVPICKHMAIVSLEKNINVEFNNNLIVQQDNEEEKKKSNKTNMEHLMNAIQRAKEQNFTIFEAGGVESDFIVLNHHDNNEDKSEPKAYNVKLNQHGEICGCDCPHFHFRGHINDKGINLRGGLKNKKE